MSTGTAKALWRRLRPPVHAEREPARVDLTGRVVVVTGASRGIGREIAVRLGACGATVVVTARTEHRTDERLPGTIHDTARLVEQAGGQAVAVRADLSRSPDRRRLIADIEHELGRIDYLVNNAASTLYLPVEELPERGLASMWAVQVEAPFELCRLVLPGMRKRGAGSILNISSKAARHPAGPPYRPTTRPVTGYGMCKAALERLTTGLAHELHGSGISVNALAPKRLVVTPGASFHHLDDARSLRRAEPPGLIAEAALRLLTGDPHTCTGRIVLSQDLLAEQHALHSSTPSTGAGAASIADVPATGAADARR